LKYAQDFSAMHNKAAIAGTREYVSEYLYWEKRIRKNHNQSSAFISFFRILEKYDLHSFEAAQLSNLSPADEYEAKSLIPSLGERYCVAFIRCHSHSVGRIFKKFSTS
jgi:hypothetical protein